MNDRKQPIETFLRDTPMVGRLADDNSRYMPLVALLGQLIEGRYKVLSLLGRGGMGMVYLVEDIRSRKCFALKTISSAHASAAALKRFEMEARATSLLVHPNLINVLELGLIDGEHPFYVMEFCEGQSLAEKIKTKGALSQFEALELFITICGAVEYAHGKGVVHRDLKPSNIMLTSVATGAKSVVKVLDFGIAKVFRDETAFNTLTRTGEIMGSPLYMSPEQCLGKPVDSRSDIYALGCVFFECLTGTPPFLADNALSTMLKHQMEKPPSLREATMGTEFSTDLEQIVATMLAKAPDQRYKNLSEVIADLDCVRSGVPLGANQSKAKVQSRRSFKTIAVFCAAAVALLCGFVAVVHESPKQHKFPALSAGLPTYSMEAMNESSAIPKLFAPNALPGEKERTFYFPKIAIGTCGFGDFDKTFTPACGERVLRLPISLTLLSNPTALAGFRNDEVRFFKSRGLFSDDAAIEYIKNWTLLEYLNIAGSDVTDKSISIIKKFPKLVKFDATETSISTDALCQLPLERFQLLSLNRTKIDRKLLLTRLVHCGQLTDLQLSHTGLTDDDMVNIAQISSLKFLDLRNNRISDVGLERLSKLKNLNRLWLAATDITPASIDILQRMTHLKWLLVRTESWSEEDRNRLAKVMQDNRCKMQPLRSEGF